MTIPFPVLLTVPIPAIILLVLLTCYHLTPLLSLLPHLTPFFRKLADLIPHPGRARNLPREFFNLPPRPEDDASSINSLKVGSVLGVRGKLMLLLLGQTTVSIACGWAFLMVDGGYTAGTAILLSLSILPLPSIVATLALYSTLQYQASQRHYSVDSNIRRAVFRGGGITHDTLYPRILPLSLSPIILGTVISAAVPGSAGWVLLGFSCALIVSTLVLALASNVQGRQRLVRGAIRLRSTSPGAVSDVGQEGEVGVLREKDVEDWVSSPGTASDRVSAFSYSPSFATPEYRQKVPSRTDNGSPTSWLSSPTATPSTMAEWTYSPGETIATPGSAITRERSRSPSPVPEVEVPNLPRPPVEQPQTAKSSATTMYTMSLSTPGTGLRSMGGSMLGEYSPDPFHPMPRNFQSLSSYPISPSRLASPEGGLPVQSRTSLVSRALRSVDTLAFVPEERTASTFTLETYHSASDFVTPGKRRAPPPPPMPTDLPLPPTPTFARSETLFDWPQKDSTELLMGERDWVEVVGEGAVSEWGREGRGVGVLALSTVLVSFALYTPLLIGGGSDTTVSLYLVSLVIPPPLLAITSYLLRYRPAKPLRKGSSTQSIPTHRSLALCSESQLSIPIDMSPKLTPPVERRQAKNPKYGTLLEPKPSISNFGYDRGGRRPHTVYEAARWDVEAEARLKRTLARRSGDVWIEEGHAIEGGGLFARAAEMIKPFPALRVLDSLPEQPAVLKRLRGGVMSMLGPRTTGQNEKYAMANVGAPEISISSPSKYDRRISGISTAEGDVEDVDRTMASAELSAEIKTAQYGRMSKSPTFQYGHSQGSFDVDWLSSRVLPGLIPGLTIGPNVRVGPRPVSMETPKAKTRPFEFRPTPDAPRSTHRTRGSSSSVDWTPPSMSSMEATHSTPIASLRQRLRHKASFSLPSISPVDFADVRRSFHDCGRSEEGVDLPLIPHGLSPVAEESNDTFGSVALGVIHADKIGMDSMISEDEAMAEEMERVMAMDTPTRAEFVISPPPDSFISRRMSSRASCRSDHSSRTTEEVPPIPQLSRMSLSTEVPTTTTASSSSTDSNAQVNFSRPTRLLTQPSLPIMSHPHPPPLHVQRSMPSMAAVSMAPRTNVTEAHPPLTARTLNNKQSSETLRSQSSALSSSDDHAHRFEDAVEEYRPSRSELILVQRLKERAEATKTKAAPAQKTRPVSQLRPLQLLSDRNENRMSAPPLSLPINKRISVLADGLDNVRAQKGSGSEYGPPRMGGNKRSKTSTGKENRSVQKGSGVSTLSGGGIRV